MLVRPSGCPVFEIEILRSCSPPTGSRHVGAPSLGTHMPALETTIINGDPHITIQTRQLRRPRQPSLSRPGH